MKYCLFLILLVQYSIAGAQSPALTYADSLYAVGNYSKAIHAYNQLPEISASTYLNIARSYKGLGNRKEALIHYKHATEKDTSRIVASVEYGKLLVASRKFQTADTIFSKLCQRFPENPEFFYQRGLALANIPRSIPADSLEIIEEMEDSAFSAFAKAVQLDSTHQKALYRMARHILRHERDYPRVEQLCFKALESAPENVEIIGLLAQKFLCPRILR